MFSVDDSVTVIYLLSFTLNHALQFFWQPLEFFGIDYLKQIALII